MRKTFTLFLLLGAYYSQAQPHNLDMIFSDITNFENSIYPEDSLYQGMHIKGPFGPVNPSVFQAQQQTYEAFVNRLNQTDDDGLTRQEYISKQIMLLRLGDKISQIKYGMYMIPMTAEGGFYQSLSRVIQRLPFETPEDYESYLAWLPAYVDWMESELKLMQAGIATGIVAPKVVIQNNIKLLSSWTDADQSVFFQPFENIPVRWDASTSKKLKERGKAMITNQVVAFYRKFKKFLQTDYLNAAPKMPGVSFLPHGKAYYEDRVRFYTTLNLSPDSVHRLGLLEVARIHKLMDNVIRKVGFKGSFADFLHFLRTDPQFYAKTPQELLNHAAWLSKKAEGQLPRFFKHLYSLPFTVEPVPDDIAPTYTGGRYVPGSWSQQRAGIYWVNTYKLDSRPFYTLPPLTLHEAVPGHHLQGAIANELTGLPPFRKRYYISAFGEGWGLYSEFLGEEMGMYSTPYELFGRYTYEMWRACRLVVDTGIHYKGWTRQQAVDYMQSNTALSLHEVNTEIDRYIGWPGQAVSYKIGELKIKALRKKAEEQLGDQFDIREFHQHILKNGSVPLTILEEEIDNYIEDELAE